MIAKVDKVVSQSAANRCTGVGQAEGIFLGIRFREFAALFQKLFMIIEYFQFWIKCEAFGLMFLLDIYENNPFEFISVCFPLVCAAHVNVLLS